MDLSTITVRPLLVADIPAAAEVESLVFRDPWPEEVLREELAALGRCYLVLESGSRMVAYGGIKIAGGDAHLMTIGVVSEMRGRGLGTRLMLALIEEAVAADASHLTLEVRLSNEEAHRLYRRFGFAPVGVRPGYYADEDALVMWALDIDGPLYTERLSRIKEEMV